MRSSLRSSRCSKYVVIIDNKIVNKGKEKEKGKEKGEEEKEKNHRFIVIFSMPLEDTCLYSPIKAIAEVRRTVSLHKRGGRLASTIRLLINRIVKTWIRLLKITLRYKAFSRRLGISRETIPLFVLLMSYTPLSTNVPRSTPER